MESAFFWGYGEIIGLVARFLQTGPSLISLGVGVSRIVLISRIFFCLLAYINAFFLFFSLLSNCSLSWILYFLLAFPLLIKFFLTYKKKKKKNPIFVIFNIIKALFYFYDFFFLWGGVGGVDIRRIQFFECLKVLVKFIVAYGRKLAPRPMVLHERHLWRWNVMFFVKVMIFFFLFNW